MILIYFKEMRGKIIMVTKGKGSGYHLEQELIHPVDALVQCVTMRSCDG